MLCMPFGRHKNKRIDELPSGYLLWVAEALSAKTELNRRLIKACDDEWQYRERYNCHIKDEE